MGDQFKNTNYVFNLVRSSGRREILERQMRLPKQLSKILNLLKKEQKAIPFLAKVTRKEAPNYFEVISRPMDLGTMTKKLGLYRSMAEFKADLDLIWDNCLAYNVSAEYYRDCALSMREVADGLCSNRSRAYPMVPRIVMPSRPPSATSTKDEAKKHVLEHFRAVGFENANVTALELVMDALNRKIRQGLEKGS
ncbi:Y0777 [Enterospora canceri]|uniref:Y0777 n=1 Tax=Enterospora canceri TaxID=1081671 RepID=A0A1Y1S7S2_9MICR|nr:Y0777 [Enterospora canceri]